MPDPCRRCGIDVPPGVLFCRDCAGSGYVDPRVLANRRRVAEYYRRNRALVIGKQRLYRARRLAQEVSG